MRKSVELLREQSGFTLIEIMFVIMIIGILLTIGVPTWMGARDRSSVRACVSQLRDISYAKETWAMEYKKADTDTPTWSDLLIYIKTQPVCPSGGTYTIGTVEEDPVCSIGGQHVVDPNL